jgi:hypothetical protein
MNAVVPMSVKTVKGFINSGLLSNLKLLTSRKIELGTGREN